MGKVESSIIRVISSARSSRFFLRSTTFSLLHNNIYRLCIYCFPRRSSFCRLKIYLIRKLSNWLNPVFRDEKILIPHVKKSQIAQTSQMCLWFVSESSGSFLFRQFLMRNKRKSYSPDPSDAISMFSSHPPYFQQHLTENAIARRAL